jgi:hypothetical protein
MTSYMETATLTRRFAFDLVQKLRGKACVVLKRVPVAHLVSSPNVGHREMNIRITSPSLGKEIQDQHDVACQIRSKCKSTSLRPFASSEILSKNFVAALVAR